MSEPLKPPPGTVIGKSDLHRLTVEFDAGGMVIREYYRGDDEWVTGHDGSTLVLADAEFDRLVALVNGRRLRAEMEIVEEWNALVMRAARLGATLVHDQGGYQREPRFVPDVAGVQIGDEWIDVCADADGPRGMFSAVDAILDRIAERPDPDAT